MVLTPWYLPTAKCSFPMWLVHQKETPVPPESPSHILGLERPDDIERRGQCGGGETVLRSHVKTLFPSGKDTDRAGGSGLGRSDPEYLIMEEPGAVPMEKRPGLP